MSYTDWQMTLKRSIGIEDKIILLSPDMELTQDYVPAGDNAGFYAFKSGFKAIYSGEIIHFDIQGFRSYVYADRRTKIRELSECNCVFKKNEAAGSYLPEMDDGMAIYPQCAEIIKSLVENRKEQIMVVFDCEGFRDCVNNDVFQKIRNLLNRTICGSNTLVFIGRDKEDIPCDCAYTVNLTYPNYKTREAYLSALDNNIPILRKNREEFTVLTSGYTLKSLDKLCRISKKDNISDPHKLLDQYHGKGGEDVFAAYDKKTVKALLEREFQNVKGNHEAIERIKKDIIELFGGMNCMSKKDEEVPLIYFMTGPSGCGKSELAKRIGRCFGENNVVKISFSEYSQGSAVNDLLGSSKGYIGYGDASPFECLVGKRDISVIIFDECEKGDLDVIRALLKCLNDGHLILRDGKNIDFTRSIVIFTSNLGVFKAREENDVIDSYTQKRFDEKKDFAFGIDDDPREIKKILKDAVIKYYNDKGIPEFINRITENNIIPMLPLNQNDAKDLVDMLCKQVADTAFEKYGCKITIEKSAREKLYEQAENVRQERGEGRGITKKINRYFRPLSNIKIGTTEVVISYPEDNRYNAFSFNAGKVYVIHFLNGNRPDVILDWVNGKWVPREEKEGW